MILLSKKQKTNTKEKISTWQSRRVYTMKEIDGLSTGEIAARTGLAANAVRRIISRVRQMVAAVEAMYDA